MDSIYLDNNATTPVLPEVAEAMREAYSRFYANAASPHRVGRQARVALEEAREGIGELLGAETRSLATDQILFTSGGTEANHLALRGLAGSVPGQAIISAIEHPSLAGAAGHLAAAGWQVDTLPCNQQGVVLIHALGELLSSQTRLVSLMLGNNETGVLQPVQQMAHACRNHGVVIHTDAVQAAGKIDVHFKELGVDALSVAAHKFHGPCGIGVLLVRNRIPLEPLFRGGFQQRGLRPGTEPVALAIGMHEALKLWHRDRGQRTAHLAALRDRLEQALLKGAASTDPPFSLVINGASAPRLPHTTSVAFPGLDRQALVLALDLAGLACSTGSACASGSSEPSSTLTAMGLPATVIRGSIRLSVGQQTSEAEIDAASERILKTVNTLWKQKSVRNPPGPPPAPPAKTL